MTDGNGAPVTIDVYPEAHHGFDRIDLKQRTRPEVPAIRAAAQGGAPQ